jgi:hypothetical protein
MNETILIYQHLTVTLRATQGLVFLDARYNFIYIYIGTLGFFGQLRRTIGLEGVVGQGTGNAPIPHKIMLAYFFYIVVIFHHIIGVYIYGVRIKYQALGVVLALYRWTFVLGLLDDA